MRSLWGYTTKLKRWKRFWYVDLVDAFFGTGVTLRAPRKSIADQRLVGVPL
jgi:hypothetical protein